jgi:hypothetical protein
MVTVNILAPTSNDVVPTSTPFSVSGRASGRGGLEPSRIDSVMVAVDGGTPVSAKTSIVRGQRPPTVTFVADVTLPNFGLHEIEVTATDNFGLRAVAAVSLVGHETGLPAFTPRESLQVVVTNPAPPTGDWASAVVEQDQTPAVILDQVLSAAVIHERGNDFPVCMNEWAQVTAQAEDYDDDPVGFSGWLLQPECSQADFPFSHPFGNDWECMVALDAEHTGLLAAGNVVPDGRDGQLALGDATGLGVPVPSGGLMAVETDGRCIPAAFTESANVQVGDRIAGFGRWIVDTGHSLGLVDGSTSYRAEVHPPLLMAVGGARTITGGQRVTRIMLTSRPYLVQQRYTTDIDTIYDDSASNDGPFLWHLNNEVNKLHHLPLPQSTTIEAHPKVCSKPFRGVHLFTLTVRPPAVHTPAVMVPPPIEVRFQFRHRAGVAVQVVSTGDGVDLVVALNSVDYFAPPLPQRTTEVWDKDRLDSTSSGASDLVTFEQIASIFQISLVNVAVTEAALAHGIETDSYALAAVDVFDGYQSAPFVRADQITPGQGVIEDNAQPYPIVGFLEICHRNPGSVAV